MKNPYSNDIDAIESLRRTLDQLRTELAAKDAEIERLRAALLEAGTALDNYDYDTSLFDITENIRKAADYYRN